MRVKITLTPRMVRTVRKTTTVMDIIQTDEGRDEDVSVKREGEERRGDVGENGDVFLPPSRVTAMLTL